LTAWNYQIVNRPAAQRRCVQQNQRDPQQDSPLVLIPFQTNALQSKKEPRSRGLKDSMEQSYPALFAAGVLMLLVRRPLPGALAASRAGHSLNPPRSLG
jgi:hypothetical protein